MENVLSGKTSDENITNANLTQVNGDKSQTDKSVVLPTPTVVSTPAQPSKNVIVHSPCKGLPNIQPKGSENLSHQRPLIPKTDAAGFQAANQPGNVLIPQGIQHVLINGQLFPIIQTANGTHLLIQQPVGQMPNTNKQVFTAQPIQFGGMVQQAPAQPSSSQAPQPVPTQQFNNIPTTTSQPAHTSKNNQSNYSTGITSSINNQPADSMGIAPVMPIPSTGMASTLPLPSSGLVPASSLPSSQPPPTSQNMAKPFQHPVHSSAISQFGAAQTNPSSYANNLQPPTVPNPQAVNPQTHQLLVKIQHQINAFKQKPVLDEEAKKTLAQLQQAQHQVLNNIQSQMQAYRSNQAGGQQPRPMSNTQVPVPSFGAAPPTGAAHANAQPLSAQYALLLQQGVTPNCGDTSVPIIKPATDGTSPLTEENILAVINAFSNVKVGTQIYKIQLMEGQKKSFIEAMSTMSAEKQHSYVVQQQREILQTVFLNQQQVAQQQEQLAQQQLAQQHMQQQFQHNQSNFQHKQPMASQFQQQQTAIPPQQLNKSNSKSRSKRRPGARSKNFGGGVTDKSPVQQLPPPPTIPSSNSSITNTPKHKPPPKKPKYSGNLSAKKISERMLNQIMKDQEVVLKPGAHKRPFTSSIQLQDRLLKFHLFYTAEPYKAYRKLQEEQLYRATAHETVLMKEKLADRFRSIVWADSVNFSEPGEDRLIAELLLEDEREALEEDELLEINDIEQFKSLYREPDRVATPPPPSPPSPTVPTKPSPVQCHSPSETNNSLNDAEVTLGATPKLENEDKVQSKRSLKSKTNNHEFFPESDIIRHLKRETAREARERRAAKRGSTISVETVMQQPSPVSSKRSRRGRPPKLKPIVLPTRFTADSDEHHKPSSETEESSARNESEDKTQSHTDDRHEVMSGASSPVNEKQSIKRIDSPKSEVSDKTSMSADEGSDSENELIDIGSPLTPPSYANQVTPTTPILPPTPTLYNNTSRPPLLSPDFTSPSSHISSYTSSPKKGFSICTETVFEQSEQPDNSFGRRNSSSSHSECNASNLSDGNKNMVPSLAIPPSIGYQTQYSEDQSMEQYDRLPSQDNTEWLPDNISETRHALYNVEQAGNENMLNHQISGGEGRRMLPELAEETDYEHTTDEEESSKGEFIEDGGVAVAWEDNTENVPSEADMSAVDSDSNEAANDQLDVDTPIMPIRINKNKLGDYMWASDESVTASPPPIRLKIHEPTPPPIKIRIKRDGNDKWEAASSVSSFTSEQNSSADEASEDENSADDECSENGSVGAHWENRVAEGNNSNFAISDQQSDGDPELENDIEEDMPFSQYS